MNLKGHSLLFLIFIIIFGCYTLHIHQYGRLILGLCMIPFLDPDQDQMYSKLHRFWFSHSIFPGLLLTIALNQIIAVTDLKFVFLIFSGYSLVHLLGDLKSNTGFGSIKLWPIKKSINIRVWVIYQVVLFMFILCILILFPDKFGMGFLD